MAQANINTDKYLIFIDGEKINYVHNEVNMVTTYCNGCWTKEEYTTEQEWLDRLTVLGVVDENLGINITEER